MQQYIDQLKDIFKDKKSLYTEIHRSWNHPPNYVKPTSVFAKLIELKYVFTQSDFNNFITLGVHNKKNGFINWSPYNESEKKIKSIIIKELFAKFTPTDKQFKMLFCCFDRYTNAFEWVDTLVERNYSFTQEQKQLLVDNKYDATKLFGNAVSVDDIKKSISSLIISKSTTLENVSKILDKYVDKIPDDILDYTISIYKYNDNYYYDTSLDMLHKLIDLLIAKGCSMQSSVNDVLVKNEITCTFLFYKLFECGLVPNTTLKTYLSKRNKSLEVFIYLNKFGIKYTVDDLNQILCHSEYLKGINTKGQYNNLVIDTTKLQQFLLSAGYDKTMIESSLTHDHYLNIYKFMLRLGVIPNMQTLEMACDKAHAQTFIDLTKNYKFQPTKKMLDVSLKTHNLELISNILCYKIIPDSDSVRALLYCWSHEVFELLVKFGLELTFDDLKQLISRQIEIPNLERFDIPYDESLYYICYLHNFFPMHYDDKFTIDKKTLNLRQMCRNSKTTLDEFIVASSGTKIDKYCYDHACNKAQHIANHLNSAGYKQTLGMFYWLNTQYVRSQMTQYITFSKTHNINSEYMQSELELELEQ